MADSGPDAFRVERPRAGAAAPSSRPSWSSSTCRRARSGASSQRDGSSGRPCDQMIFKSATNRPVCA